MTAGRTLAPPYASGGATVTGVLTMAELRPGDVVADRFRILRLLGMGGMGVVYQAHDTELDVDVALKLLRPELASRPDAFERFRQELLLARQVSSPNVVRIHDLVRHGEVWLISMDFVPGQSLERLLDTKGHLPPEDAIRIVRQLALGLSAAHQRGVVHRDLKPANVLISEDGEARITDFGVARSAGSTGITVSGVIIGTPEYLSPEQARADPVDGRSDLYALGLIFFEMLTGTLPFRGGTPAEMLAQRIVRDPPLPDTLKPDLPSFAVRLCARLLELKPSRRFQSADDVVRAIDQRRVPRARLSTRAPTFAAIALVLLTVVAFAYWRRELALAPPTTTPAIPVAVDIASMPFVTSGGENAADGDLAAGIRELIGTALIGTPGTNSEDTRRVDRALKELGYDADAARRQRARVVETLSARELLEGDIVRDGSGNYSVHLSIWPQGATEPTWTAATTPASAETLPAQLRDLETRLYAQLKIAGAPATWPDTSVIRLIGQLRLQSADQLGVSTLARTAEQAASPALWWSIEDALDRSGRVADLSSLARQAKDALASQQSREAIRARAYALVLLGENEDAAKILDKLVAETPDDHPARVLLARAKSELGDFEGANKILQSVVAEDPRNEDAWFALGKYTIMAGDSKRAVDDYLARAQILANRLDDARMKANVTHALGIGYQNLGQLDVAAQTFTQAIQARKAVGDTRGVAVSLRNLSTVRAVQGDFKGAQSALDEARALLEPLGDTAALADLSNDEGVLKEERGDYRGALASYRGALSTYQALGNARQIGSSLLNVGFAYYQVGEFDNAEVYWNQAASTYAKANDYVGIVRAKQSLGLAETARGNFTLAREALDDSLKHAEELQMAEERSISLANLADLDRTEGKLASALDHAKKAFDEFKQREDSRGTVEMQLLESAAFRDAGDWDAAAAAIADLDVGQVANSEQAALLLGRQAEIALGRGNADDALAKASKAISTAQEAHSYGTELSARLTRVRALAMQKKTKDAAKELAATRADLAKYASTPLRLALAETALEVNGIDALPDYRAARAELARLPAYGRAFEIHALAASIQRKPQTDDAEREALRAAEAAYDDLQHNTPPAQRAALAKFAGSYGIPATAHE
ncbi:MAG TPA: protein kinase [Rhodanobacteraceae bacterium]|jgi:tetratricopeptide (TPR) repeat protein|nr:protein kinase [Rhodanobacteraceae bacterium]